MLAGLALAAAAAFAAEPFPKVSCPDARELETAFTAVVVQGQDSKTIAFSYAGCRTEGRNDYLPPYTERNYNGAGGYGLTIVTYEGANRSEVLLSSGKEWIGRFGIIGHDVLLKGEPFRATVTADNERKEVGHAVLRSADPAVRFPELKACEENARSLTRYGGWELRLLTDSTAYYYHEDCDICAAFDACDLKTGRMTTVKEAHSVDCSDLFLFRRGQNVRFDACPR